MKNIQNLTIDINKKPFQKITANVGEVASRFIRITILDNNIPIDLTGVTAYLYAKKADGTKVFNNVTIENKANGIILAELTSQVLAVEGVVKLTLLLVKNGAKLCSKQFLLNVDSSIIDDKAIESTNEFTALVDALAKVGNIENKLDRNWGSSNAGKILVVGETGDLILTDYVPNSGGITGELDEDNNIILTGYIANGVYEIKYENEDGTYAEVGELVVGPIATYSITQNLSNVISDNSNTTIREGKKLNINLTAAKGYFIGDITVIMGGVNITSSSYSNGKITIANVTGDIVITAIGEKNLANPSSSDWIAGHRLSNSGTSITDETEYPNQFAVTNYIPCKKGDVIKIRGFNPRVTNISPGGNARFHQCASDKSILSSHYVNSIDTFKNLTSTEINCYDWEYTVGTNTSETIFEDFADNIVYIRFGGHIETTAENVIITGGSVISENPSAPSGPGETTTTYSITQNLTNATTSNAINSVTKGDSFTTNLSTREGYDLVVNVTMGGLDITSEVYSNGKVTISSVTGNVIITVSTRGYTNLAKYNATNTSDFTIWCNDSRMGGDGSYRSLAGYITTNYIEASYGDVIRIEGIVKEDTYPTLNLFNSSKTSLCTTYYLSILKDNRYIKDLTETSSGATFTINHDDCKYIRFSCKPANGGQNVIVTKNEEIS